VLTENQLQSTLNGADYFSVAILPDDSPETFADFRAHAYAFVTGSRVDWAYDEAAATLTSTFTVETEVMEGTENQPLIALYRHQWRRTDTINTDYSYVSPRGEMKVLNGSSFSTTLPFTGVLPWLPDTGSVDQAALYTYIDEIYQLDTAGRLHLPGPEGQMDTYWTGKGLGRLAALIPLADQAGHTEARETFIQDLETTLEDWFTVADGDTTSLFYYDTNWGALIGYPTANYGYDYALNDHHFHHGYFVMAASMIALYDPAWTEQWGGMVDLLIEDANNPETTDLFPRLRAFDAYAGHSWASGDAAFDAGNNQESSSEAINFATAVILWGEATGNSDMRDLGIFLYANEAEAIRQYWFDVDDAVFPADFDHNALGILWSNGGAYGTWFSADPEAIHAINFLPINGGSLYLGDNPNYIQSNYDHMITNIGGVERSFTDIIWETLAFADPTTALDHFGDGSAEPEWGETRAHIYHWLHTLDALGQVEATITADIPTYAVFTRDGITTYVAYNASADARTVQFSDGFMLDVPSHAIGTGTK
jgi:endoglucanase Acf2